MKIRGLLHLHSKYSYDGKIFLRELAHLCRVYKYKFVIMTEHAESLNDIKMKEFVRECKAHSDENLIIIPGLEFTCGGVHILGLGINECLSESNLANLITKIHNNGGIAVVAHVNYYKKIPYDELLNIDGLEIWNAKYDGWYAPSLKCLKILKKFKYFNDKVIAFCGLDLHSEYEFGKLSVIVNVDEIKINQRVILELLKEGDFQITNGLITIDLRNSKWIENIFIVLLRSIYIILFTTKKCILKFFKVIGFKTPKKLAKMIKRII